MKCFLCWHLAAGTQGILCYRYVVSEAQRILREFERSAKPRFGALRSLICPGMETQQVLKLTPAMLCCNFVRWYCGCVRLQAGQSLPILESIRGCQWRVQWLRWRHVLQRAKLVNDISWCQQYAAINRIGLQRLVEQYDRCHDSCAGADFLKVRHISAHAYDGDADFPAGGGHEKMRPN